MFHFEWHSILSDISFWVTFHFEWHSILSDIPFWMTFHYEWHFILIDIPFWVTFHFEWHPILSDWLVSQSQWWDLRWYRTVNFQSVCQSVSQSVSQWVSEWVLLTHSLKALSRSRDASASKNRPNISWGLHSAATGAVWKVTKWVLPLSGILTDHCTALNCTALHNVKQTKF